LDRTRSPSQSGTDEIRHPVFTRFFAQFSRMMDRDLAIIGGLGVILHVAIGRP